MRLENFSALNSEYIINGVPTGTTPAQMLRECMSFKDNECLSYKDDDTAGGEAFTPIVDETVDPTPCHTRFDPSRVEKYLEEIYPVKDRHFTQSPDYPGSATRKAIAKSLIDAIWKKGHFRIENIEISARWDWNADKMGNMAKFFLSAEAASQYIYDLGINLKSYEFNSAAECCLCEFQVEGVRDNTLCCEDFDNPGEIFLSDKSSDERSDFRILPERKCPDRMVTDETSWLIYIPFDTCRYRLGDSLLTRVLGNSAETAPEIQDPDYFIDCYEVVREFVEDGVLLSGVTVANGGLLCATKALCGGSGTDIDISGIETAFAERDIVRILFGETPGVIIQIADADYDYVDSQLLLQDLAYYPLGHPTTKHNDIVVKHGQRPDVSNILASLIEGQYSEGED